SASLNCCSTNRSVSIPAILVHPQPKLRWNPQGRTLGGCRPHHPGGAWMIRDHRKPTSSCTHDLSRWSGVACILAGVLLALATLVHPSKETPEIILAQEGRLVAGHWL